ncbi:hemoglobin [Catalinimonas alkaloidigena]|uniref:group III truncated hemoglobin n=1 Tax=Catalinimonas alkaloidigena TaxID=1075417 RepID=UPI0024067417|nr:group III truncated hemoglobin [Catalinimonas alkaloidigena]MDF9796498.1 hemoglobin [Catalinimonas alkaloidigena]
MDTKNSIAQLTDIKQLVDSFYAKVRDDMLLAPVFNERIGDRWPEHLEKMYKFWQTVLLSEHTYFGSPFVPHARLEVDKTHFKRWLTLFEQTVDEHFKGEKAEEAKWRAGKMAEMFLFKIEYYRDNPKKPIL